MNNNNIIFSIITVSYNSDNTIEKTILSILNQDFDINKIEYIIIDGGSTDNTINIIEKYKENFPNLFWISEKDNGIYDAMNKGIRYSNGEIIGIVNSDDWLEHNALSIVFRKYLASNNKNALYAGSLYFHYSNGDRQYLPMTDKYFNHKKNKFIMPIRHPATFVPKKVYDNIGVFDTNFLIEADCDFIYRCIEKDIKFIFISNPLSNMLDGGVSNNSKFVKRCLKDRKLFYKKRRLSPFKQNYHLAFYFIRLISKLLLGKRLVKFYRNNQ